MYDHRLDAFIKVAETGSFSKAGEELFTSPTAVIKKINALENNLGIVLFERTHHGVTLTAAGKAVYQDAKYIIRYTSIALNRAKHASGNDNNIIRLGYSLNTPCDILVDIWPRILEHCPTLKLQIVPFENTKEIVDRMFDNMGKDIDAYIGLLDPVMLEQRKCSGLRLRNEPFKIAVPRDHFLAGKKCLRTGDLFGENLMLVRKGKFLYYDVLREKLETRYPQIKIEDCESVTIEVFNHCEHNGSCMVIIDPWKNIHPLFKTIPVSWKYSTPYGIVCAKEPSPQVLKLLAAVEKAMELTEEDRFY